jgi:hypothetical protein
LTFLAENGKIKVRIDKKIADALEVSLDDLIK